MMDNHAATTLTDLSGALTVAAGIGRELPGFHRLLTTMANGCARMAESAERVEPEVAWSALLDTDAEILSARPPDPEPKPRPDYLRLAWDREKETGQPPKADPDL